MIIAFSHTILKPRVMLSWCHRLSSWMIQTKPVANMCTFQRLASLASRRRWPGPGMFQSHPKTCPRLGQASPANSCYTCLCTSSLWPENPAAASALRSTRAFSPVLLPKHPDTAL